MTTEVATTGGPRRRIVAALALTPEARAALGEQSGAEIIDIRDADGGEELILAPAVSRQLLDKLRRAFPRARLLVVEVEDEACGAVFVGPVLRTLRAGADGYYVADTLAKLGEFLREGPERAATARPAELAANAEDELGSVVDDLLRRRAAASGRRRGGRVG
jgi:hypothetical protein